MLLGLAFTGCASAPSPQAVEEPKSEPKRLGVGGSPVAEAAEPARISGEGADLFGKLISKYQSAKSFQATSQVKWVFDGDAQRAVVIDRLILIQAPDKFHVTSITGNLKSTSISDGTTNLEFTNSEAFLYHASANISQSNGVMISNENYCGSLLYGFFGSAQTADEMVHPTKREIERFVTSKTDQVEIKFTARDPFGTVTMVVDEKKLEILSVRADMEPRLREQQALDRKGSPDTMTMTETFSNIKFGAQIDPNAFKTTPPSGLALRDRRQDVALNSPAPLFDLKDAEGKPVALRNLRDRVVMLLFVNSFNTQCRDALKTAQSIIANHGEKGLAFYAVTKDSPEEVNIMLSEAGVKVPVLFDSTGAMMKEYKVLSTGMTDGKPVETVEVPNTMIIDRRGRFSALMPGPNTEHDLVKALRRAGLGL